VTLLDRLQEPRAQLDLLGTRPVAFLWSAEVDMAQANRALAAREAA
jgi:hypothetical protein